MPIGTTTKITIWNLTQHSPTPDQINAGVKNLPEEKNQYLKKLLTFEHLEECSDNNMYKRAYEIVRLVKNVNNSETDIIHVMIAGAPYFMPILEKILLEHDFCVHYAFSKREVKEIPQPDGSVKKTLTFKHEGFIIRHSNKCRSGSPPKCPELSILSF